MTIYALFLCIQAAGTCHMQGEARMVFGQPMPATTYSTLAECQQFAKQITGGYTPKKDGRFLVGMNPGMWYECRSKHVDTWETAR